MIELIYEELKRLGAVKTYDQFSCEWLGMEKSYMRSVRAKHRMPSAKALARCAVRLKSQGDKLNALDKSGYRSAAAMLRKLSEECIEDILKRHGV